MCSRFSSSFRYRIAEDLRQECAIKLVELLKKTDLPDSELIALFRVSLFNLLCDFYRAYKRTFGLEDPEAGISEDGEELLESTAPSPFDLLVLKEYADAISLALEFEIDRRVLELLLAPPRGLVESAARTFSDPKLRATVPQTPGSSRSVEITGALIAESLAVSAASISRSMQRLRRIVKMILDGD